MKEWKPGEGIAHMIEDLKQVSVYIWQSGCTPATGGNLSLDVTDVLAADGVVPQASRREAMPVVMPELGGRALFVTGSGARFRDIPGDPAGCLLLVRISPDGERYEVLWGGERDRKPTMEFVPHLKIHEYMHRSGGSGRAILHAHPVHLIAMSHMPEYRTQDFVRVLEVSQTTARIFLDEGVGMVGYFPMGSLKLAEHTVDLLNGRRVVLWERHGCVAVGHDVFEAFDLTDALEKAAEIFFACVSAGYEPRRMTYDEIAALGYR